MLSYHHSIHLRINAMHVKWVRIIFFSPDGLVDINIALLSALEIGSADGGLLAKDNLGLSVWKGMCPLLSAL